MTRTTSRVVVLAIVVGLAGCNASGSSDDSSVPDAAPDAAACTGGPPGSCEAVVAGPDQCPDQAQICDGVCGPASYDCCYCGTDGTWQVTYIECFGDCDAAWPDAALPDAALPDAP